MKSEARNPKLETISMTQILIFQMNVSGFSSAFIFEFEILSDFDIRISNLVGKLV
jgi:hypothetical protein